METPRLPRPTAASELFIVRLPPLSCRLLLLLFLAAPLPAQFEHLSTTADGSVLYFSSTLPLRDSGAPHQGRIFRWDAARGVQVLAERTKEGGPTLSNYYDLSGPSITESGDLIAFNGRRDCRVGTFCVVNPQTEGVVHSETGGPPVLQEEGYVFLSRNGRYALLAGFLFGEVKWIDLATGRRRETPRSSFQSYIGSRIADDGTYVAPTDSRGLILQTADGERTLATSATAWNAAISANGATVVYESQPQPGLPRRVYSIGVASGRETLLFVSDEAARGPSNISISSNGRRVLILTSEAADRVTQWIFLIDADGSRDQWHTYIDEGFREAILSGDGRVIFAVSNNNRLFRIDAESGRATELITRSPFIATLGGAPLAGSSVRLLGSGFIWSECRAEGYPLPESLCGIEVEFLGKRMPIDRITPSEIRFQIPWDTRIPPVNVTPFEAIVTDPILVRRSGSTIFAPPQYARARVIYQPRLEPDGVRHEDGSAVTLASRAKAGETLKVYATGLGPVDPSAPTGHPPPSGASHRVTSPIDCAVSPEQQAVELLAAVLAPGRVGIYELTVRLPDRFPAFTSVVTLNCRIHEGGGAFRILPANVPLDGPL